jgi:hypothetical protein
MSVSGFSGTSPGRWLQRPIHYERIPLRSARAKVPLELALMALALAVLVFTGI